MAKKTKDKIETVTIDDLLAACDLRTLKCRNCGTSHQMRDTIVSFLEALKTAIKTGKSVYLHGFARFSPKQIKGRTQKVGLDTIAASEGGAREITFGDRLGVKFKLLGTAKTELNTKPAKRTSKKTPKASAPVEAGPAAPVAG